MARKLVSCDDCVDVMKDIQNNYKWNKSEKLHQISRHIVKTVLIYISSFAIYNTICANNIYAYIL